jgi:glycerate kinase
MKILLMPNPLKGSLSAGGFCRAVKKAFKNKYQVSCLPVSDGGDGLIDVFKAAYPRSKEYKAKAEDALSRHRAAPYLLLPGGKTCVIETAKICGLGGLKKSELRPLSATSKGVGQVILAASKRGANNFYIGLGGVACNDGGAGMAAALGFKLLDKYGKEIPPGAQGLLKLAKITGRPPFLKGLKFYGLSDVKNPLLGPLGSAAVYGPQKGASPRQVITLEAALKQYTAVARRCLKKNINKPRCGAAGAIGAGIYGFLNASLLDGGPFIFDKIAAEAAVKSCNLVITAEGRLDRQTFFGKAPQMVCRLAKKHKKPVFFVCGSSRIKDVKLLRKHGIAKIAQLVSHAGSLAESIKNPVKYIAPALKELL